MRARRIGPDGGHSPEDLVAQDRRQWQVDAPAVVLHVGAARPAELDGEQRTVATDVGDRVLADLELAGRHQRGGPTRSLHWRLPWPVL